MNVQVDQTSAAAIPALAIASTMTGITFWPFLVTAVFAVCALVYQDQMPINKAFANVIASTAIGGAISQILAIPTLKAIAQYLPFLAEWTQTADQAMVALIAITFGLVAHVLMPTLLRRISVFGSKQ